MRKSTILIAVLGFLGFNGAFAQTSNESGEPVTQIVKPVFLRIYERIPDIANPKTPLVPEKDFDGKPLRAVEDNEIPDTNLMVSLTDPIIISQIKRLDRKKTKAGKYEWGIAGAWNCCHSKDKKGNDWYGWRTGGKFHWTIFKRGRFWWRDNHANRWLFFYKGYWWWPNGKTPRKIQVYMNNGNYYVCDAKGLVGANMGPTGK